MESVIVENLWKIYSGKGREIVALRDLDFKVYEGEILGVIGPNGAGKTTLSLILSGLLQPTKGRVYIMGESVNRLKRKVCQKYVALYLSGYMNLVGPFLRLPALEYLKMVGAINCIEGDLEERAEKALEAVGLTEWKEEWPSRFSTGMKRKLMLAEVFMYEKPILILDEPTVHLDPASCIEIWHVLKRLTKERKTVLLTTQNMEEAEYLCDKILFLHEGRKIAFMSPEDLKSSVQKYDIITLKIYPDPQKIKSLLRKFEGVVAVREGGDKTLVIQSVKGCVKPSSIIDLVKSVGVELLSISYERPLLSDVFRTLLGEDGN